MAEEPKKSATDIVRTWITKHGYPLEYRVAHRLREAGFAVEQSAAYQDDSGDGIVHEIDVRGGYRGAAMPSPNMAQLVIECKRNLNPWMVFMANEQVRTEPLLPYAYIRGDAEWARKVFSNSFSIPRMHGLAAVEAWTDKATKGDAPHDAMTQAVAGAQASARELRSRGDRGRDPVFAFVLPVVVVSGALVTFYVDPAGGEHYEEPDRVRLAWSRYAGLPTRTHIVDLVTEAGLPGYLASVTRELDSCLDLVDDNVTHDARARGR